MKKYFAIGGIVVAIIIIAAVATRSKKFEEGAVIPLTPDKIAAEATLATVNLIGAQNGIATIAEVGGTVQVQYGFVDAPEGVVQPAHIQAGTCANPGDLKFLLEFPADGISTTDLDVTVAEFKAQLPLIINVRKSLEELTESVACGEIVMP